MSFFADKLGPVPKPLSDKNSTGQPHPPEWAAQQIADAASVAPPQSQPVAASPKPAPAAATAPPPAAAPEPAKKKKGWF